MSYEQILYDVADSVATITLNRPDRLNAVTARSIDELIAAFDAADADDGVRAVIVTGAGRAFCAGADLGAGGRTFDRADRSTADEHRDGGGRVTLRIFDLKKPVIAAINGPAVGFGIMSQAAEWALTGRVFSAEEALAGRLVSRVVAPDALLATARELAREIADNTSAVSVALIRQMLWKLLGADHPREAHRIDSLGMFWTGRSPDAREGIEAFIAKRPARFSQRPSTDMPPFYPWWR